MEGQDVSDLENIWLPACTGINFDIAEALARKAWARVSTPGTGNQEWKGQSGRRFLLLLWVHSQSGQVLIRGQENRQQSVVWNASMLGFSIHTWFRERAQPPTCLTPR